MRVSTIKSNRNIMDAYNPRNRKSLANFRSSNSVLSLLDCIEPPKQATAAPLLKSLATASPIAVTIKSAFESTHKIAFQTTQPTVLTTMAPVQPTAMTTMAPLQPTVASPDLDTPVSPHVDVLFSIKSLSKTGVSSIKSSIRRRWNPWTRNTYYPRYRKSLLQTRDPLGTLQPRPQYVGSRQIVINHTKSPHRPALLKSLMRKPPKGVLIRNTLGPINLEKRTVGPRAAGHFDRPSTMPPRERVIESTQAPVNPFPRIRRSGYFTVAPKAPVKITSVPVPQLTAMPVAAPTWAPFPRYRRSRACIVLSSAPLSKNSYAPIFKGIWQSKTFSPQIDVETNSAPLVSPLIAITATNSPFISATGIPSHGLNVTGDSQQQKLITLPKRRQRKLLDENKLEA
ncbi:unnamed protein product [Cylindrotheca closterium]|uniref:Uncharacterized protein n=1 Tax=Cylindrotheca closterium TaxID=2856 RepID=A0AAD2GCW8_9STRA|nr:unnamed protein product [Cylindrotheca closterium]